ncbi:MAG TPA: acyl-CoA desaturase, partial [Prochlorococcus sp.]
MVSSLPLYESTNRQQSEWAAVIAPREPLPAHQRRFKWGTTSFMVAMHVAATFALLPRFWSWQGLVAFGVLYWMTVLGVTLGLHRLVAHRSFVAPSWLEKLLVIMATLACQ